MEPAIYIYICIYIYISVYVCAYIDGKFGKWWSNPHPFLEDQPHLVTAWYMGLVHPALGTQLLSRYPPVD